MTIILQWRQDNGSADSYCYHVQPKGNGYEIVGGPTAMPIATIKRFEPMPGQFRFWGKVWEWNSISASFIVHNYEHAAARNLRSWLNKVIRQTLADDCEIIGGKKGRPAGSGAREARNRRDRARRLRRAQAERFAHIEALIAKAAEPMPAGLTRAQVIDWYLDNNLDGD